jgi:hypothetical protein
LNSIKDPVTKANTYATSGLWYDALAEVALLEDPQAKDATVKLLDQLATTEQNSSNLEEIVQKLKAKS